MIESKLVPFGIYATSQMKKLFPLLGLVLGGSGLVLTVTGVINGLSASSIPVPKVEQWVDFGAGSPRVNGNSFDFPTNSSGAAGYFYTKLPAKAGQTLTLNYSITGNNPVWQQHPQPSGTDSNPAFLTLFVWRTGDDLACGQNGPPTASYRMWYPKRNILQLGVNQVLSVPLDPNVWTNCFGKTDPAGFTAALADELGLGFTFGGASFYGHGVYLSSGTATFTINSFTVD
jgi:hypothetical protein